MTDTECDRGLARPIIDHHVDCARENDDQLVAVRMQFLARAVYVL